MSKWVTMVTWDEVPHLSEENKKQMWASIPAYQRDARAKGIPMLGSGAIFPMLESEVICEPFSIPKYYPRVFGLDIGWNRTAAVWAAKDEDANKVYLYAEHYGASAEPAVHAAAIRAKGAWIPGVIDPASRQRSMTDGSRLVEQYSNYDLTLFPADNSVDAGISTVWDMLSGGRLKVFSTLQNWRNEFRIYRRDEKGKIVKKDDHLMDATRYLIMSGLPYASTEPGSTGGNDSYQDYQRSSSTGY